MDDHRIHMTDVLSSIACVLDQCKTSDCKILMGGDFNFAFDSKTLGHKLVSDFFQEYDLHICDHLFDIAAANLYTYKHQTLNHSSFLDHFAVNRCLMPAFSDCVIYDSGCNLSDHFPICAKLKVDNLHTKNFVPNNKTKRLSL